MKSMFRQRLLQLLIAVLALCVVPSCQREPEAVRLLGWVGYEEKDLLDLIESRTGVRVLVEPFVGGDQMFQILLRNPDGFDLVVVDPEYIEKLVRSGTIQPLRENEFDFSSYFPALRHFDLSYVNGKLYAVLIRFGINGLVYNTKHLTPEEASSYAVLKSEKLRGHIVLFDWYLPNMGVFSRILGNSNSPYDLDGGQFTRLQQYMKEIRPAVSAIQSSFSEMVAALASEQAWAQPTAGESLTWVLRQTNPAIDWTVPAEGGILWCETLAIPTQARNESQAIKVIRFLQSPEGQAALVRRKAYIGAVPNEQAYRLLTDAERSVLKISNAADAEKLLSKVSVRRLPVKQTEAEWQQAWTKFKAGN
jgi:spermidine/putrescine transport system substrate-binding protein